MTQYIYFYILNLGTHFHRALRPDFWGPISPKLIKRYDVEYKTGDKGDFTNLNYNNDYFDVVTCISVLEHMPLNDRIRGIKEMSRVLKKGGKLIITYDKHDDEDDLTDSFIKASGLKLIELVYVYKPKNLYNKNHSDTIGMVLIE